MSCLCPSDNECCSAWPLSPTLTLLFMKCHSLMWTLLWQLWTWLVHGAGGNSIPGEPVHLLSQPSRSLISFHFQLIGSPHLGQRPCKWTFPQDFRAQTRVTRLTQTCQCMWTSKAFHWYYASGHLQYLCELVWHSGSMTWKISASPGNWRGEEGKMSWWAVSKVVMRNKCQGKFIQA